MDFNKYFEIMDRFTNEMKEEVEVSDNDDCCMKPHIIEDILTNNLVCNNCGIIKGIELEPLYEASPTLTNPTDNLKGIILGRGVGNFKPYNLRRTGMYIRSEECYKSTTLYRSYDEMEKLMKDLDINDSELIDNAKYIYKQIYLYEDEVNTRYKIKIGLYIYCIINVLFECNVEYDILSIFSKIQGINIGHYNKAVSKLGREYNKYLLNENMKEGIKILKELNIIVSQKDIINRYNYYISKEMRINKNSILKGCIYELIINGEGINMGFKKMYIKLFKTTLNTLEKFIDLSKTL